MRILFITAFPPNNITAGQYYSMRLLKDLSFDYDVEVICWNYKEHPICLPANVKLLTTYSINSNWKTVLMSIALFLFPFFLVRFNWKALQQIKEIASSYDFLYFDFGQVFLYSLFVKHPCKIKMCHDVISQKYSRKKWAFIYNRWVSCSEKRVMNHSDILLCFSEKDRMLINALCGKDSHVVPFYIDDKILNMNIEKMSIEPSFFFYGAWNRIENTEGLIWFVKNVLPLCSSDVFFKIIGGGLSDGLRSTIEKNPNMEYLGFLDNPYEIMAKCQALIAPLFNGAGVKVKVIESLALGTPVIGTNIAFEGIENFLLHGKKVLLLAQTPAEFADLINNFSNICGNEKKEVRNRFLSTYTAGSFTKWLKNR